LFLFGVAPDNGKRGLDKGSQANIKLFMKGVGMIETLQCLKKYGQRLDLEIAKEMRVPIATVRQRLASLAAAGEVVTCTLTRFEGGKRIDAWQCRVSGYIPPPAPGRKAKSTA
jgi:hypothetical protein